MKNLKLPPKGKPPGDNPKKAGPKMSQKGGFSSFFRRVGRGQKP